MHTEDPTITKLYTFAHEYGESFTVKADSLKDCEKKLHRYCNDMYETKGRQLKRVVKNIDTWIFQFCGRDVTFKFMGVTTL